MMQTNLPISEEARQAKIDSLSLQFQAAKTISRRRILWAEIAELIKGRSPETVAAMEKRRGIYTERK